MPSNRHRNHHLLSRRRRTGDDGEDDEIQIEDSDSDASLPSDTNDDGDADNSDLSGTDPPNSASQTSNRVKRKNRRQNNISTGEHSPTTLQDDPKFAALQDTETMMNGLGLSARQPEGQSLDFDTMNSKPQAQPLVISSDSNHKNSRPQETLMERRRREHEEYKKKRDEDPAFIPNRGAFFMHDHRSAGPGQNGFRPFSSRGRGRGRGGIGGPFSPVKYVSLSSSRRATTDCLDSVAVPNPVSMSTPWKHDLHDTLAVPIDRQRPQPGVVNTLGDSGNGFLSAKSIASMGRPTDAPARKPAATASESPLRSFDVTRPLATANVRVFIQGMKEPKIATVDIKSYAKLPNHRPPLRRDKPVRVSLPDRPPRYIFPASDRSFIFIPRALRPNQTGSTRGRPRGPGSITGFSSRRTSIYGGSGLSPSAAVSRRSSIVRDFNREALLSPAGSIMAGRPVVRVPYGSQQHTPSHSGFASGAGTPTTAYGPQPPYALPQKPHHHENLPANLHMHQPRPQKQYSVAGLELPPGAQFVEQEPQQPFHQQVPPHVNGQSAQAPVFHPAGQQLPVGANIPQAAIHAQPFQPYQQSAYSSMPGQSVYYYPPTNQTQYMGPMYIPGAQQYNNQGILDPNAAQSGDPAHMMAYEQNGMVYYYDPGHMQQTPGEGYAMQGMGGTMTPAPDGYYYPQMPTGAVYYPPQ